MRGESGITLLMRIIVEPSDLLPALVQALQHPDVRRALGLDQRAPAAQPPKYMTPGEYAERLRVGQRTVRKWQARGLPVVRVGHVVRVDVVRADAWLEGGAGVRSAVLRTLRDVRVKRAAG